MTKTSKNIAFIGNQIAHGGGAASFYLLIKSLSNYPINLFVFASQIRSISMQENFKEFSKVVECINISEVKSSQTSLTSKKKYKRAIANLNHDVDLIVEKINKYEIDIIHFNNSVFSQLYELIKRKTKVKIITHVREMVLSNRSKISTIILDNIINYSDHIITISDNEYKMFNSNNNISILPNPINLKIVNKAYKSIRKKHSIGREAFVIGMIGRPARSKGHILFLRSVKALKENGFLKKMDFKFLIIGVGNSNSDLKKLAKIILNKDFEQKIRKFIHRNRLEEDVILVPYTKNVFPYINDLDLLIRPSLFCDPWGRDIIEAMAFGKPIIATGHSQFYIENNTNGFLVEPSAIKIAEKIKYLFEDKQRRIEIGVNNTNKISQMCNLENYGDKVLKIYNG
jgi:glycosyltransferase involved in cell wall biosynthesis